MTIEFLFDPPSAPEINDKDKGYYCTACGSYIRRYRRHFNSNMAIGLLFLYHNRERGFIHLENEMKARGYKRCGDASYLRHYRLIEPMTGERPDGSSRNGFYRITGAGILFCEQKYTVQEIFITFHNELEGFDGKMINITDALGKKFNYSELISHATFDSYLK